MPAREKPTWWPTSQSWIAVRSTPGSPRPTLACGAATQPIAASRVSAASPAPAAAQAAIAPVTASGRCAPWPSGSPALSGSPGPGDRCGRRLETVTRDAHLDARAAAAPAVRRAGQPRSGPAVRARAAGQRLRMTSRTRRAVSLGVRPTRTPAFSRASFLAWAVPEEPDTIAPACPIVLPSGAVKPAT